MSTALEDAARNVLIHGRSHKHYVVVPIADFAALAESCQIDRPPPASHGTRVPQRDPAYERDMRQLFANAELDP